MAESWTIKLGTPVPGFKIQAVSRVVDFREVALTQKYLLSAVIAIAKNK